MLIVPPLMQTALPMMSFHRALDIWSVWEAFFLVLHRELALSFRRPDQLLQPLVFFLIVTTLFPLGLSVQLSLLRDMAPGVLWVAALLSSLLSLDALFKSDADDGTLEQLALSGQGLNVIVMAKTLAHWLVSGAALVLVSPIVGTALAIPEGAFGTMMLSLSLGTLTLSWLGSIGAGLTVGLKRGNVESVPTTEDDSKPISETRRATEASDHDAPSDNEVVEARGHEDLD